MVSEDEFNEWFRTAKAGDVYVYHVGDHLFGLDGRKRQVASLVLGHSQRGELFISQKRLDGGEFQYQCMKLDDRMKGRMKSWYH